MYQMQRVIVLLCLCGAFCSARVAAQSNNRLFQDFDFVKSYDARLLANPAGLCYLPVSGIAMAELKGSLQKGKLVDYYQSDNSLSTELKTESYYRLNSRIVMHGSVRYHYFQGQHMGGSALIDPTHAPFNIVEYTDTTRGTKQKETYQLVGGLGYNFRHGLKLGVNIDYTATNYTKRKDLRHRNKMLDMTLSSGFLYPVRPSFEIGASYRYRKRVEGVFFNIYGNTDRNYTSLIDFGAFYGRAEGFTTTGDGYTSGKTERPLVDQYHEGDVQVDWHITPRMLFHTNFSCVSDRVILGSKHLRVWSIPRIRAKRQVTMASYL